MFNKEKIFGVNLSRSKETNIVKIPWIRFLDDSGRDEFGNRLFSSNRLSYEIEGVGDVRGSLLVSGDGEELLRKNPGFLKVLNEGLKKFSSKKEILNSRRKTRKTDLRLSKSRMSYLGEGCAHYVYRLSFDSGDSVAVKISQWDFIDPSFSRREPMILKMLQTQDLIRKFEEDLLINKMRIAKPLMATGQVLISEYVKKGDDYISPSMSMIDKMYDYVDLERKKRNDLWRNSGLGIILEFGGFGKIAPGQFVSDESGYSVCVDPIFD